MQAALDSLKSGFYTRLFVLSLMLFDETIYRLLGILRTRQPILFENQLTVQIDLSGSDRLYRVFGHRELLRFP